MRNTIPDNKKTKEPLIANQFKPYGVSVLATAIALLITLWQKTLFAPTPTLLFFIAIILSNWYGGLRSGILAAVLSTLAINYFFIPPLFVLTLATLSEAVRLGIFILVAFIVNVLSSDLRRSKRQVEQLDRELFEVTQKSAEQLKLALTAARMGMWNWNMRTGEITWSPEHEQLFGLAPGTFDGRYETFDQRLHPDDREALNMSVNRAIQERNTYQHEYRVVWTDGSIHWIEGRGQAFYDETGQAVRMTGTVMDISDRKNVEAALASSERRLRTIIEAEPECIKILTAEGTLLDMNAAGLAMIEADNLEQVLGQNVCPIIAPVHRQAFVNLTRQVAQGKSGILEFEIVGLKGTRRWLESHAVPLQDESGAITEILAVTRDITQRKQAEAALQKANEELEIRVQQRTAQLSQANEHLQQELLARKLAEEALRESEERWQLAIRGSSDGIWDWNVRTNEVFFSSRWKEMLGFEDHEISNHLDEWAKRVHPGDLAWVTQVIQDHFAKKTPFYVSEHRVLCKDDTYKWILDRGQALWDEAGNVVRMAGSHTDITERQQMQEALQQSESTLRSFFDSASMMMGIVELIDDDILHISDNTTTAKLFGLTPEAMQNRRASEMGVPQEFLQMWLERYREAERTQSPVRFEYAHETDQGQRWLSATVSSIALSPSKRQRFAYVVEDISDRKHAEEERDNLIAIIEASPDYIGIGFGMRANYLNRAAREWIGLHPSDDLANFSISDAHPNWAFEIIRNQAIPAAIQDGVWLGETAFLKHDGREIPTSQLLIAHKRADGSVKMFSTIARDITQQKQAETSLREAERRWRYLLENVRLLVVGLDITGKVEFVNAFFLEVTGYTQADVLGKDWFETFLPLQAQQQVQKAFQDVLEQEFHPHYTNAILTKSGEERIIAWNNTLLQNLQGEVIGTMSIGEDITERHAVEKMKNEFISIVSHELRTPLTSIRGSLGMLATGALNNHPERMRRMIEIAAIDTERLVRLVNDILDLERLDSGKVTLVKECCDAAALMEQSVEAMRSLALKENITLSVSSVPALVWASDDHIIQTLTNLLSNAIKFSPANSTITLSAEPLCDRVLFQVKDQGRGIPADKLETIFGRFQQVDASDSRKQGGTGLGLAICHSIITQHGGRIWVESVLGEGSTFYFTLPVPPQQALSR